MRALLVDDEPLARLGLRQLAVGETDLEIVGECEDGPSAIHTIETQRPDLLFLDVQMPGLDGFEVLEAVAPDARPLVIFVTAYDLHALRAFEVHAVDYLLKPVTEVAFRAAVLRARTLLRGRDADRDVGRLDALLAELRTARGRPERFLVRTGSEFTVIPVADVDWIEADGDYVRLHQGRKHHLHRARLSTLESTLDPERFARVHRSAIVALDRVARVRFESDGDGEVVLHDGQTVSVSRTHREAFLALLARRGL